MGNSHARRSRDGLLRCVAFPRVKAAATGVPQWLAGTSTQSGHWHAPNGKDDLVSNTAASEPKVRWERPPQYG
jgi:hypothetical protein